MENLCHVYPPMTYSLASSSIRKLAWLWLFLGLARLFSGTGYAFFTPFFGLRTGIYGYVTASVFFGVSQVMRFFGFGTPFFGYSVIGLRSSDYALFWP